MNFALLGADPAARNLLTTIISDRAHRLKYAVYCDELAAELLPSAPGLRLSPTWDDLLTDQEIEAVIVAGSDERVLEAARQLAASGRSLIVYPNAGQGTTWYYELGLIRDDGHIALVPVFPARFYPAVRRLHQMLADGSIGKLLQLQLERTEHIGGDPSGVALLSERELERAFLPDVDLLHWLGGDYSRITALRSGLVDDRCSQALQTLSGDGLPEALWSMKAAREPSSWNLAATGSSGTLALECTTDFETCVLACNGNAVAEECDEDPGQQQLQHCLNGLAREAVRPDWADLTRAAEICDGARRSIRRRRTIDLHFESTSERSQFKTHMTAIGCSLLTLTLLAVICVLIFGTLLDPRDAAELKADHAGATVGGDDFLPGTAEFTEPAGKRLDELAERMPGATFPVLIDRDGESTAELQAARRAAVVQRLQNSGADNAEQRTHVVELKGKWFQRVMSVLRMAVFIPLGLFLILQLLLFIARPGSKVAKAQPNAKSAAER